MKKTLIYCILFLGFLSYGFGPSGSGPKSVNIGKGNNESDPVHIYITDDTSGTIAKIDDSTLSLIVIDSSHHEIHEGDHYEVTDIDTDVDIAGPKYWHIITPNTTTWVHLVGQFYADGAGTWEFYENPTTSANGTQLTAFNNNRNSSNNATSTYYYDPTVSADGTRIWRFYAGEFSNPVANSGGGGKREQEFVLKQNEQYFIKFTPDADNTVAGIELSFYEHANP